MKYSIVIPVYNVEKYLKKCIDSVINQKYKNIEIIIINDGSLDNSQQIIDYYVKKEKRIKAFIKKNGGLSSARNFGITKATGDYLMFLDSDDYFEEDLIFKINQILTKKEYDVLHFLLNIVTEDGELIRKEKQKSIGEVSLEEILKYEYIETAYSKVYKLDFWKKNNFLYTDKKIHEDFGLTPLILLSAKNMFVLNFYGINYVQRKGSIVNGATKNQKRFEDMLYLYDQLINIINQKSFDEESKKIVLSFISNGILNNINLLDKTNKQKYIKEIKEREILGKIKKNTVKRKIKYIYLKLRFKI